MAAILFTQFGLKVHLDKLQLKFDYRHLGIIFKVMEAILIVVEMASADFLEK